MIKKHVPSLRVRTVVRRACRSRAEKCALRGSTRTPVRVSVLSFAAVPWVGCLPLARLESALRGSTRLQILLSARSCALCLCGCCSDTIILSKSYRYKSAKC